MIIGLFSVFLCFLFVFLFCLKTLIYQTPAAELLGGARDGLFSSYPTFLPPSHVVPDGRIKKYLLQIVIVKHDFFAGPRLDC